MLPVASNTGEFAGGLIWCGKPIQVVRANQNNPDGLLSLSQHALPHGEWEGLCKDNDFIPVSENVRTAMILTQESLEALFNCNAPNRRQIATLGIGYPLRKGWMQRLIGTEISDALYAELLACKGRRPRFITKRQWRKPCTPCEQ